MKSSSHISVKYFSDFYISYRRGFEQGQNARSQSHPALTLTAAYVSNAAREHGIKLEVVKLPTRREDLSSYRDGVERSFGWMSRFRRLARDYDRLPEILAGLRYVAFIILMLKNVAEILA